MSELVGSTEYLAAPLKLIGVGRRYRASFSVKSVSIEFAPSTVTLLLGANGSGKSTLLRLAAGLLRVDEGEVLVARSVGYLGHKLQLYLGLSVLENLKLFTALVPERLRGASPTLEELIIRWQLKELAKKELRTLSRGQQVRVALARTFCYPAELILLDEPTAALDDRVTELLKLELARVTHLGAAVLVATHDVSRLHSVAQRVVVMKDGKIEVDAAGAGISQAVESYRSWNH